MSILKTDNVASFLRTIDASGYFGHGSHNLFAAFSRIYPEQADQGVGYFSFSSDLLDISYKELMTYYKSGFVEEEDDEYGDDICDDICDDPDCDNCNPVEEEEEVIVGKSNDIQSAATKEVLSILKKGESGTRFRFYLVHNEEFEAKLAKIGYRVIAKVLQEFQEFTTYSKLVIAHENDPHFISLFIHNVDVPSINGISCGTSDTLKKYDDLSELIGIIRDHVKISEYKVQVKKGASCFMIGVNDLGRLQLYPLNKVVCDLEKSLISKSYPNVNESKIANFFQSKNPKGKLLLFHGIPGSGKTTYIRHLLSNVYGGKVVFVNAEIFSKLTSASFIPFAIQNLQRSLLLIEDAEQLLVSRGQDHTDRNSSVADLLNYTDGLLGDALNLKVLATFNTSVQEIDSALLRKGRLNHREEFSYLDKEQAEVLYKHLTGEDKELEHKNYSLADIYGLIPDE